MLSDVFPPAVASTEEAQGERLAAFLFGNVASKRFAHQRGHGNTLAACQGMELVVHRLFNKKCGSFHMTYSSIQSGSEAAPPRMVRKAVRFAGKPWAFRTAGRQQVAHSLAFQRLCGFSFKFATTLADPRGELGFRIVGYVLIPQGATATYCSDPCTAPTRPRLFVQRREEHTARFIARALVNPAFLLLTRGCSFDRLALLTYGERGHRGREGDSKSARRGRKTVSKPKKDTK